MEKKLYKKLDDDVLEKLHDAELEILSEIDRICKKHNLNYFLVGGTLFIVIKLISIIGYLL